MFLRIITKFWSTHLAVLAMVGCGVDDDSSSATTSLTETSSTGAPQSCPDEVDAQGSLQQCDEYYWTLQCCGLWSPPDGEFDPAATCSARFTMDSNGAPVPAACASLITAIIDCAVLVATVSCGDLASFEEGILSNVGPPTIDDMPCYDETIAAYDAGCEPFLR